MNPLNHGCRGEVFRKLDTYLAAQNRIAREIRGELEL